MLVICLHFPSSALLYTGSWVGHTVASRLLCPLCLVRIRYWKALVEAESSPWFPVLPKMPFVCAPTQARPIHHCPSFCWVTPALAPASHSAPPGQEAGNSLQHFLILGQTHLYHYHHHTYCFNCISNILYIIIQFKFFLFDHLVRF